MANAEINHEDILSLFDYRLHDKERYLYPVNSEESIESIVVERFTELRDTSESITLVDGAFDVPHNNHEWYLRHCKLIGAFAAYSSLNGDSPSFADFASYAQRNGSYLEQQKLVVTLDADNKIAFKKSGLKEKGGIERPVYPWTARADRLAGYHFGLGQTALRTVDLVTVEGDSIHEGTPLESSLALAAFLKSESLLDRFIIYGEHDGTISEAEDSGLEPIVIPETHYELNPQTEESWSSSRLIKRAQGQPVPNPVTRPHDLDPAKSYSRAR